MISKFKGQYAFLSNFFMRPIIWEGIEYPSSEHAYQAAKTRDRVIRQRIADLPTAAKAKAAGKRLVVRDDWEVVKVDVMRDIVAIKFRQHPDLAEQLLATGTAELREGNTWGDIFWGVNKYGTGLNWLGRILMDLRLEIANQRAQPMREQFEASISYLAFLFDGG